MKNRIYIITGLSKTGKTTRLMSWVSSQKNIDGILQPVIEDKRFFYHISSRTLFQLESDNDYNTIKVGKYKFRLEAFNWANEKLNNCIGKNLEWIVVDEIGLLEINGEGLNSSVKNLLSSTSNEKIIFVIRETLLQQALNYYKIDNYKMMRL
ncbi:nucleoside-triphosphatase [Ignavibacteria bacterium 4148-Me]|uniref:nucleoside-triphosphatase n=1 Tax=Rosettibacter primus TaxID=3111523 RepID=UPI00336BC005